MKNYKFKIIGTNTTTKNLTEKIFELPSFILSSHERIVSSSIDDKKHTFEIKEVKFINGDIILEGFVSDEDSNVGRISLKYLP